MGELTQLQPRPVDRPNSENFLTIHEASGLDPFANKPLNVLLTLEGGGAKGIVHLGAYRELEYAMSEGRDRKYSHWPKYRLRGVSGTSIGALVAALIAVGYSSREMVPELPLRPERPAKPVASGRRFHLRDAVSWISWIMFGLLYSGALAMYSLTLLTGSARSKVLENAGMNRVTDVFGAGVLKFIFLKWLATHPITMSLFLVALWIGSLLLLYFGLVNIYPLMHALWQYWYLSDYVPESIANLFSAILISLANVRYAPVVSMLLFAAMTFVVFAWASRCLLRGLLKTDMFQSKIDRALAVKLLERFQNITQDPLLDEAKRNKMSERVREITDAIDRVKDYKKVVTFQMLRDAECLPLAMAATNIRSGELELFSTDMTPKICVADAVAASAAVPLLFQPVEIEGDEKRGLYWDGGFTSNLPAWPYDAQREINPDLYTITVEITGHVPYRPWTEWRTFKPFRDFLALVTASVFGARELETRRTRRAAIELNTGVRLLDFNMGPQRAHEEIEWARLGFRASLNVRASVRKLYADKCFRISQAVRKHLMGPTPSGTPPRIRVSLLQPTRYGARALKTLWRFCSSGSFRRDTDDRLLFRKETSVPGLAWATFSAILQRVERRPDRVIWTDREQLNNDLGPRHRYSHRLLWDEMEWMLAVPVARRARRGSTDWVVAIDSNIPLDHFEFSDGQGKAYRDIVNAVREIARELWEVEDNARAAAVKLDEEMGFAA